MVNHRILHMSRQHNFILCNAPVFEILNSAATGLHSILHALFISCRIPYSNTSSFLPFESYSLCIGILAKFKCWRLCRIYGMKATKVARPAPEGTEGIRREANGGGGMVVLVEVRIRIKDVYDGQ